LVADIARVYPSFPQEWVDDRTRTEAVLYLLREKHPNLILCHLVDLDSEEHDRGPFEENANAVMERTDELIGQMLAALPKDYVFALVSDHGFERVDRVVNLRVLLANKGVKGELQTVGGLVATSDNTVAAFLKGAAADPANGIGREIPHEELVRYAPQLSNSLIAYEPADHVMFGSAGTGEYNTTPAEKGDHGFWPTRDDYRSVFLLSGPGISPAREPGIQLISIAHRLAAQLGFAFP
jgi:predicted AlkP superfamily pyrophosphatase or phosphodiesterase